MKIFKEVEQVKVEDLLPYPNNPKLHPDEQIKKVASSIKQFGFTVPLIIDKNYEVVSGHGRLEAAKVLGLESVPCIIRDDLTEAEVKALRIADNKVFEKGQWDWDALAQEIQDLLDEGFDLECTGFSEDMLDEGGDGAIKDSMEEGEGKSLKDYTCVFCGHAWRER